MNSKPFQTHPDEIEKNTVVEIHVFNVGKEKVEIYISLLIDSINLANKSN